MKNAPIITRLMLEAGRAAAHGRLTDGDLRQIYTAMWEMQNVSTTEFWNFLQRMNILG
jgi:plasmid stability protein